MIVPVCGYCKKALPSAGPCQCWNEQIAQRLVLLRIRTLRVVAIALGLAVVVLAAILL